MKLTTIIWSIWHRCFFAARKAEKKANDLQEALRKDLRDFEDAQK